ncbi:MAG: GNAT family N-acetyltransferase, partial [Bacteroidota bacterium]
KLFGLPQVQRPILCQQLAWFSPANKEKLFQTELQSIPSSYRRINLSLQSNNLSEQLGFHPRINLVLDINRDYAAIQSGYSKSLRKRLRRARERLTINQAKDPSEVLRLYRQEIGSRLNWGSKEFDLAEQLLKDALARNLAVVFHVYLQDTGELVGAGSFLLFGRRVINILGATNELGKDHFAMHLLIDHAIKTHQNTFQLFDFEGSELPGVATFFRSFGAVEELYYDYHRDTLPAWVRMAIQIKKKIRY